MRIGRKGSLRKRQKSQGPTPSEMDVWFATNRATTKKRDKVGDFKRRFHGDGPEELSYGKAVVRRTGQQYAYVQHRLFDEKGVGSEKKKVLGSKELFSEIRGLMADNNDTILYVHGFNTTFGRALNDAARLAHLYGTEQRKFSPVAFAWPSEGKTVIFRSYKTDRSMARVSGAALGRAILKAAKALGEIERGEECGGRIHLLCHSMGNYVLRHAVSHMGRTARHSRGTLPQVFDQIILMAADEDMDAFEHDHKLMHLPELGKRTTVYFNREDRALVVSDLTKSNPARLGMFGPRLPLNVPANVSIVDATPVVEKRNIIDAEHSYHTESSLVRADIRRVLGGQPSNEMEDHRTYDPASNHYVLKKEENK